MLTNLITTFLVCGVTSVVNHTEVWSEHDQIVLDTAKERCKFYYPEAPCLKVFYKKEEKVYWSVCGEEK